MTAQHHQSRSRERWTAGLFGAVLVSAMIWSIALSQPPLRDEQWFVVGSATPDGQYHRTAIQLCALHNAQAARSEGQPLCAVQTTEGSLDNMHYLASGRFDFALLQTDVLCQRDDLLDLDLVGQPEAMEILATGPQEPLHILVNASSGITEFDDILGRKIHRGTKNSGTFAVAKAVFEAVETDRAFDDDQDTRTFTSDTAVRAICEGDLDAAFRVIEAGKLGLEEAVKGARTGAPCELRLLSLSEDLINKLTGPSGLYEKATALLNPEQDYSRANSIAPRVALVARQGVPPDLIASMQKRALSLSSAWTKSPTTGCFTRKDALEGAQ